MQLNIDYSQFVILQDKVAELGDLTGDMRQEWKHVSGALKKAVAATFREEGPGWAQLAHSTQLERRRLGYGMAHPILVRDGAMRDSFTKDPLFISEPQFMWWGSFSQIARYHQGGTKHMPARPIMQPQRLLPVAQRAFEDAFIRRVNRVWHEATGRGTLGIRRVRRAA